ncbi:helix-turn-helix domain-containing protein [Cohnella cholangitidis]|uniref:helix-turn-helix domain-containing protein n=1 Tax=Cohnella cholangitidis TaxID=2598458 RepID=UPI0015FDE159|nr:helix-turn-helix transcriptional regulator [Cohnella cholangitidis]
MNKIIERGWTQTHYARLTGRHKRMISHFCADERAMQPEDIHAACLIFGCDESELHEWVINEDYLSEQAAD